MELLRHACGVEPCALARDPLLAELEDVQDPRLHVPTATFEPEGTSDRGRVQDWLVDQVVVAVPASEGFEPVELEVCEQASVEGRDLVAAVEGPPGRPATSRSASSAKPATIADTSPACSARKCASASMSI